ncbi:stage V sporulation protein AA [Paenibacillus sp. J2TS4]|uniref:stage V sporulation protein AA n=1 Tax=Paenibacillus sp. J2TS4 TaxID=2807194 RepID=UPI001B1C49A8|nr:stage V sporulation protein AA [Paenibacillus sp. J2TS4]GIP32329.1 stage V sporulation protein AA [Paenibacillus sp. J2TS4]
MEPSDHSVIYIRFKKRVRCEPGQSIVLGRIARIVADPEKEKTLSELPIRFPEPKDGNLLLIDMIHVVRKIQQLFPGVQIELYGEPHVLVEIARTERRAHPLVIGFVWILLFIGSGLAIMNFHADVSMPAVHRRVHELLTGEIKETPYLLQIPYSVGIGVGMILFFNHLFKKKFNEEPSPLEVEMFLYQENLNQYIITEEYAKLSGSKEAAPYADNELG